MRYELLADLWPRVLRESERAQDEIRHLYTEVHRERRALVQPFSGFTDLKSLREAAEREPDRRLRNPDHRRDLNPRKDGQHVRSWREEKLRGLPPERHGQGIVNGVTRIECSAEWLCLDRTMASEFFDWLKNPGPVFPMAGSRASQTIALGAGASSAVRYVRGETDDWGIDTGRRAFTRSVLAPGHVEADGSVYFLATPWSWSPGLED